MATVGASGEFGDDEATARRTRNGEYSVVGADIGRHGDGYYFPKNTADVGVRSSKNPSNKRYLPTYHLVHKLSPDLATL